MQFVLELREQVEQALEQRANAYREQRVVTCMAPGAERQAARERANAAAERAERQVERAERWLEWAERARRERA